MFLDRCDICHQPKKCRGYENMIVCDECASKIKNNENELKKQEIETVKEINKYKETTIFDFL